MTKPLSLLRLLPSNSLKNLQSGISIIETLLTIPILFLFAGGVLHLGLIAQAKSNLEYASLMAARVGASQPNFGFGANGESLMAAEVLRRMRASDLDNDAYALSCLQPLVQIRVRRPNSDSFQDFGETNLVPGSLAIPNDNLPYRDTSIGGSSGMSIQDANILHVEVHYLFDSKIPFMNFPQQLTYFNNPSNTPAPVMGGHQPSCNLDSVSNGIWISADAVVVMQTPALSNAITDPYIYGSSTYIPPP